MKTAHGSLGFFGKALTHGDFLSRRLPRPFISAWDSWLQAALAESREKMGDYWLDAYLTSPIWRFALSPGACGPDAWAGVLMPSVDNVGRYFPLTLAARVHHPGRLPSLFSTGSEWFDKLELLALSALDDDFNLEAFDHELQTESLALPPTESDGASPYAHEASEAGEPFAFQVGMGALAQIRDAFVHLSSHLLSEFLPVYSLWCTSGSERVKPSLLAYNGLPPPWAYARFLSERWPDPESAGEAFESYSDADYETSFPPPDEDWAEDSGDPGGSPTLLSWRSSAFSTVGCVRKINEDAHIERTDIGLWAVADGMGGHHAGDVASRMVVDALGAMAGADDLETLTSHVTDCLEKVNAQLIESAASYGADSIVGSTVVILLADHNRFTAVWLGDSRLYCYRDGKLSQVTRDHSFVAEMSRKGNVNSVDLAESPFGSVLTKALGASDGIEADTISGEAFDGDIYLLCSDGLMRELSSEEMAAILSGNDLDSAPRKLIDLALERGAHDNVTAIVVRAGAEGPDFSRTGV